MENDDDMRKVMEQIMPNLITPSGFIKDSIIIPDLSISYGHLTKEFFQNMRTVLSVKILLILRKWENFFSTSVLRALSSPDMYFRHVIFACDTVTEHADNIFDRILNVCAVVVNFNIETFKNTGVDFCDFSVPIFMVFYKSSLKKSFCRNGGFKHFEAYIRGHEYLPWECVFRNDPQVPKVPIAHKVSFLKNLDIKIEKELEKFTYDPGSIKHSDIIENTNCKSLSMKVFSTTKVKLPTLPNSTDLKAKLHAARQKKAASQEETKRILIEASKRGSTEVALKREVAEASVKSESAKAAVKSGTPTTAVKSNTAKVSVRSGTAKAIVKCETNKAVEKSGTDKMVVKGGTDKTVVKSETDKTVVKSEMDKIVAKSGTDKMVVKSGTDKTVVKSGTPTTAVKSGTPTTAEKSNTAEVSVRSGTAKTIVECGTAKAIVKCGTDKAVEKSGTNKIVVKSETDKIVVKSGTDKLTEKSGATKTAVKNGMTEAVLRCSHSDAGFQMNSERQQITNTDWCDNIVRAVIKDNNSKSSILTNANNPIQKKANKILKRLKGTIESLNEIMENYDED